MWWLTSRLFRVRISNGRGGGGILIFVPLTAEITVQGRFQESLGATEQCLTKSGWVDFLGSGSTKIHGFRIYQKHGSKSIKEKWIMILRIRPFSCKYFMKKRWHKTDVKRMMKKLNLCINKSILLYRRISMARIQKITSNPPRWISNPNLESWSQGLDHFSGASRRYKA